MGVRRIIVPSTIDRTTAPHPFRRADVPESAGMEWSIVADLGREFVVLVRDDTAPDDAAELLPTQAEREAGRKLTAIIRERQPKGEDVRPI